MFGIISTPLFDNPHTAIEQLNNVIAKKKFEPYDDTEQLIYLILTKQWDLLKTFGDKAILALLETIKETGWQTDCVNTYMAILQEMKWKPSSDKELVYCLIAQEKWNDISQFPPSDILEPILYQDAHSAPLQDYLRKLKPEDIKSVIPSERLIKPLFRRRRTYNIELNLDVILGSYYNLIVRSREYTYSTRSGYNGAEGYHDHSIQDAINAVSQLMSIKTAISSNLLHLVIRIPDENVRTYYDPNYNGSSPTALLDFSPVRKLAKEELETRGNPKYDPDIFTDKDAWLH